MSEESVGQDVVAWCERWGLGPEECLRVAEEIKATAAFASIVGEGAHEVRVDAPPEAKLELAAILQRHAQ